MQAARGRVAPGLAAVAHGLPQATEALQQGDWAAVEAQARKALDGVLRAQQRDWLRQVKEFGGACRWVKQVAPRPRSSKPLTAASSSVGRRVCRRCFRIGALWCVASRWRHQAGHELCVREAAGRFAAQLHKLRETWRGPVPELAHQHDQA